MEKGVAAAEEVVEEVEEEEEKGEVAVEKVVALAPSALLGLYPS